MNKRQEQWRAKDNIRIYPQIKNLRKHAQKIFKHINNFSYLWSPQQNQESGLEESTITYHVIENPPQIKATIPKKHPYKETLE